MSYFSFILACISEDYCKTHYNRAPFNFTHFALVDDNAYTIGADIRSIQLMRKIKWPRLDSDGSCVNKKGRGYKGFLHY